MQGTIVLLVFGDIRKGEGEENRKPFLSITYSGASQDKYLTGEKNLARQMVLAMGLMTRKTNVPMAVLCKTNVFRFLFLPHVS